VKSLRNPQEAQEVLTRIELFSPTGKTHASEKLQGAARCHS
jgi:hypothetical protein